MNQHANHHPNHHGSATLNHLADREQIVSLKSKLHESGLPDHSLQNGSLVERLDPALGEATSGMGASDRADPPHAPRRRTADRRRATVTS